MTIKSLATIAVLVLPNVSVGCSAPVAPSAPPAPSSASQSKPPANTPALIVFKDPLTGLSTSDVRDAQGRIVQFATDDQLVWIDGTHISGHSASGPGHPMQRVAPEASCQCWLVVRF